VVSMNSLIEEQKITLFTKAIQDTIDTTQMIHPAVNRVMQFVSQGYRDALTSLLSQERIKNQISCDENERLKDKFSRVNKENDRLRQI